MKRLLRILGIPYPSALPLLIPTIDPGAIIRDRLDLVIADPEVRDGNVSLLELLIIAQLVKRLEPKKLFEIGTFDGRSARVMAANSPEDALVYTLDLPMGEPPVALRESGGDRKYIGRVKTGERFISTPEAKKIVQLRGDSATFDFSPYQGAIDFTFIDGSHDYSYVLGDSRQAEKMRSYRGIIVWHDYSTSWPGAIAALNHLFRSGGEWQNLRHILTTSFVILAPAEVL